MKITLSKSLWKEIGQVAGWTKTSMNIAHDMYVSLVDEMLFENRKDVAWNVQNKGISLENIWEISYNISTFKSDKLTQEMWDRYMKGEYGKITPTDYVFYVQLFKAASVSATNYGNGTRKSSEEVVGLIDETCGLHEFWDLNFIERNEEVYNQGRQEEEAEAKYGDDQMPGHYEEHGADQPSPQY